MLNRGVVRTAVYEKMMNKSLTMIAEECFFTALPYNFAELADENKMALHEYVTEAIESLGGATTLIKNALSKTKNDIAKNTYMQKVWDVCTEAATEVAKRVSEKELAADENDFNKVVATADFSEEEFKQFETNADKLDVEDVGKIISEKVIETIKNEQAAIEAEETLNEEIKQMVAADAETPEDAEASVESFYRTALSADNPRHYVSFMSKLTDSALEALCLVHQDDIGKEMSINTIKDLTFLYSLDAYRTNLNATEALDRMIHMDASIMNSDQFTGENLGNKMAFESAYVSATTVLTFMETMKTLNLVNPERSDLSKFINATKTPASYGQYAVESFCNKWNDIFKNVETDLRKMKSVDELSAYKSSMEELATKVNSIEIANEAFTKCKGAMCEKIENTKSEIDKKLIAAMGSPKEMTASEKVRFNEDVAKLNNFYNLNKAKNCASFNIFCDDTDKDNRSIQFYIADDNGKPMNSSYAVLNQPGTEEYVKRLFSASKLKSEKVKKTFYKTHKGTVNL